MNRILAACFCALIFFTGTAEARQRHKTVLAHPDCNVLFECIGVTASPRGEYIARSGFGTAQKVYKPRAEAGRTRQSRVARARAVPAETPSYGVPTPSVGYTVARAVSGIVAPLAAKVAEIQSACGAKVISAVRHTRIAGTRRMSLHASGQAVDMSGNPSCIYSLLQGYAGGYSIDYARMRHVHLSWGGPEHGLRFNHGGGGRYAHRHHRHHRRYASAR